jgi:hypothetical protein
LLRLFYRHGYRLSHRPISNTSFRPRRGRPLTPAPLPSGGGA